MSERISLSADEAISVLAAGDDVHAFMNPNGFLLGADWSREEVEEAIRGTHFIEIAGATARGMKHGIAIEWKAGLVWFATDEDALAKVEATKSAACPTSTVSAKEVSE